MRRFWKEAAHERAENSWAVLLDGRAVKTPARTTLMVPGEALAAAIAAEWNACGETVEPRAMPLTGLANAALDHVTPDPAAFAAGLAKYGEGDLFCYRADGPDTLVRRQAAQWEPLLGWARRRFAIDFVVTRGLRHVDQPEATVERLGQAVRALDPFRLAGLAPLVTIGGSLVAALAVFERAASADEAWDAVSLDESWQLETWGSDAEAEAALAGRRCEWLAGARFLELVEN